jgi:lysophospholipase L1-like esterase
LSDSASTTTSACHPHFTAGRADIFNRGFGGYTSALGRVILDDHLASVPPSSSAAGRSLLFTIFFGANDACGPSHHMVPPYLLASNILAAPLPIQRLSWLLPA